MNEREFVRAFREVREKFEITQAQLEMAKQALELGLWANDLEQVHRILREALEKLK